MSGVGAQSVFRFAPSPNGYLHLGHAYSALLNRQLAMESGGRLLIRIEDIDPGRSRRHFETALLDDLAWLGLDWEKPPRRQSEHLSEYRAALDDLTRRGLAYPCFCSRNEIAGACALHSDWPRDPDGSPHYPGTCRQLSPEERCSRVAAGARFSLRLDMAKAMAQVSAPLIYREYHEGPESDNRCRRSDRLGRCIDRPARCARFLPSRLCIGRSPPGCDGCRARRRSRSSNESASALASFA